MNQMVKDKNNKSSNSLVFGRWPQTKRAQTNGGCRMLMLKWAVSLALHKTIEKILYPALSIRPKKHELNKEFLYLSTTFKGPLQSQVKVNLLFNINEWSFREEKIALEAIKKAKSTDSSRHQHSCWLLIDLIRVIFQILNYVIPPIRLNTIT